MLLAAVLLTLVPVAAALASGAVGVVRTPGPEVRSGLQHVAAGVVFAAVAVELLPDIVTESPWAAIVGFAVGIAVMFTARAASGRVERSRRARGSRGLPVGLLTATGLDFLLDGVILGAGFAAGQTLGALLAVALAVEYLFVGLSVSAALAADSSRSAVALAPFALSLLTVVGTAIGVVALAGASPVVLAAVLSFGAVAFMYLATEELLPEAHAEGETALGSVGFFLGFLVFLLLHELVR